MANEAIGYEINAAQVSAVYITGSGTYTVTQSGVNQYLVKIFANVSQNILLSISNQGFVDDSLNSISLELANTGFVDNSVNSISMNITQ